MDSFITPFWIWPWLTERLTGSAHIVGQLATYGAEGYVVNLNTSKHFNMMRIRRLKFSTWVDRATRAVFIEFTTYNANVDLFCSVALIFEIGIEGGLSSAVHVKALKIPSYQDDRDYWALGFNISVLIFVVLFLVYCPHFLIRALSSRQI